MNETAVGSRHEVTVILLGHDEIDHRARALHYYGRDAVPCLGLAISSSVDTQALTAVLNQVTTPFVCLALDADFVLGVALDNAAQHLHAHPQAVAVQGHALAYSAGNGQLTYHKVGAAFSARAGEGAIERLQSYADAQQLAWRAVMRVETLVAALAGLPEGLDGAGWRVALSCAILLQGAVEHLEQTDVICEALPDKLAPAAREARIVQVVRALREWDERGLGILLGDGGFDVLNRFARNTFGQGELPLLFTSCWNSVIDEPQRSFEPRQYVELPYYNGPLFEQLSRLEFLCHAWPTGSRHLHALEGVWVRQRELLVVHPNDTAESLQERYFKALGLGLFSHEVCSRLVPTLTDEANAHHAREMSDWIARLADVPGSALRRPLYDTPSGKVLEALDAAMPDEAQRKQVFAHLAQHPAPQIAFVVLDVNNDDMALQATFDSLLASGLRNFKLLVLKGGKPPAITTPRDTLHFVQVNDDNWVAHLNQVMRQLPSEWMMLLQAGDELQAGGLLHLLVELAESPACQAICANEVQRDEQGRLHAVLRPGADLNLLRSQPGLMSGHWVLRRQAVLDVGGYSEAHRQALELDLLLRLVEAQGVGCLAYLDDYLVVAQQASAALMQASQGVLNRHLTQLGYRAQLSEQQGAGLRIDFRHAATPVVSILVASEGDPAQLDACLTSVLQRTRYPRYEVLVVCAEGEEAALQHLGARVQVLVGDPALARNAWLNQAAEQARGEYLVLLSAHCQVVAPAWIEALLNEAQRPEVGVTGAALQAVDGTLAHAGYALLEGPQVALPWQGLSVEECRDARWPDAVRSCSAVSAQCLMVRKALFADCGGLQEGEGADLDLCLALAEAGQLVVWTPQARVQASALPVLGERLAHELQARWPGAFSGRAAQAQPLAWFDPIRQQR